MSNIPFQFGGPRPSNQFVFGASSRSRSNINAMTTEIQDLKARNNDLENSCEGHRQSAWAAVQRASNAEEGAKNAKNAEAIARVLVKSLRDQLLSSDKKKAATMADLAELESRNEDLYDKNVALTEDVDDLRKQIQDHVQTINKLNNEKANFASQDNLHSKALSDKEAYITQQADNITRLEEELKHQAENSSNVQDVLNNTYADLKQARDEYKDMMRQRDDEAVKAYERELERDELKEEWRKVLDEKEAYEQQLEHMHELEETISNLQSDIDRLQDDAQDHDHVIQVKDQRIGFLEAQLQKAQTDKRRADSAANAASRATAMSPHEEVFNEMPPSGESLADELNELSDDDYSGSIDEPETPELSPITEIANFKPMPAIRHSFTTKLSEVANITPTHATAPSLTSCIIENATIETSPIETTQNLTTTIATQTETSPQPTRPVAGPNNELIEPITIIHDVPVARLLVPTHTPVLAPAPTSKPLRAFQTSFFSGFLALLALVLALLYTQASINLQAWETANGVGMYHTGCNRYQHGGAYGNGRLLFGQLPIAMDIGQSMVSERIARFMATAIMRVEDFAGFSHQPHF